MLSVAGNVARLWSGRPKGNVQPRADKFFINSRYGKRSPSSPQSTTKGKNQGKVSCYLYKTSFCKKIKGSYFLLFVFLLHLCITGKIREGNL
jgi:hypothetical protein